MHMRKDRSDSPNTAGRLASPGGRVKTLYDRVVHAITGSKYPNCRLPELVMDLILRFAHGSPLFSHIS